MSYAVTVTPSGRLRLVPDDPQCEATSSGVRRLVKAFSAGSEEGLLCTFLRGLRAFA